ncbi:MAG: A/G-specific adenine glycosylase [Phycisphaerales bacterium]|nr:A/G-specific adenine glycosylase [Phycisphaerales bacterium]
MKRDRQLVNAIAAWFAASARPLPWRATTRGRRDPYRSLVSEIMLQQTQVARVLQRFEPFLERFPTIDALAAADEADVLAAWSGLGYYRRARMLHAIAKAVRDHHGSNIPRQVESLMTLPGVGRYTAGAISSIVFGQPEPLVDGNVLRVLQRLDAHEGPPDPAWAWRRAEGLVRMADEPGVFNEGLMELGAMVCTPASPKCAQCPVAQWCRAGKQGLQERVPEPKRRAQRRALFASAVVATNARGYTLMEQRPGRGLWAGLWQPPTIESDEQHAEPEQVRALVCARVVEPAATFSFLTTHREVRFVVYRATGARAGGGRRWVGPAETTLLGIGNAQRRVIESAGVAMQGAVSS